MAKRTLEDADDEILELREELKLAKAAIAKLEELATDPKAPTTGDTIPAYAIVSKGNALFSLVRGRMPLASVEVESEHDRLAAVVGMFTTLMRQRLENPLVEPHILHRRAM